MIDDDPLMTPDEVRQLLGDSFDTVCAGGRCCPVLVNGETRYFRSLVTRGWRMYGEGQPAPGPGREVRKGQQPGREVRKGRPGPAPRTVLKKLRPTRPTRPVSPAVAQSWLEFRQLFRDQFGV
jgi:hypothetical protein